MLLNFLTASNADVISNTDIISNADVISSADASAGGIHIEPGRFVEMLPKLAIGMISIFIVIGIIIIATSVLNKVFSKKKNK